MPEQAPNFPQYEQKPDAAGRNYVYGVDAEGVEHRLSHDAVLEAHGHTAAEAKLNGQVPAEAPVNTLAENTSVEEPGARLDELKDSIDAGKTRLKDHAKWQMNVGTTEDRPSERGLTPDDIAYNMWLSENAAGETDSKSVMQGVKEKEADLDKEAKRDFARLSMRVKTGVATPDEIAYLDYLQENRPQEAQKDTTEAVKASPDSGADQLTVPNETVTSILAQSKEGAKHGQEQAAFLKLRDAAVEAARKGAKEDALALNAKMAEMLGGDALGLTDDEKERLSIVADADIRAAAAEFEAGKSSEGQKTKLELAEERANAKMEASQQALKDGDKDKARELMDSALQEMAMVRRNRINTAGKDAYEARQRGDNEEADRLEKEAKEELEAYINEGEIDENRAQELRDNLNRRFKNGKTNFQMVQRPGNGESHTPRPDTKRPKYTPEAKRERQSRVRRWIGRAAFAAAGLVAAIGIVNAVNADDREEVPNYIENYIEQDEALQEAGVTDEDDREAIIQHPEEFENLTNMTPEEYNHYMIRRQGMIEAQRKQLQAADATLTEEQARAWATAQIDKQLADQIEDLDDNEQVPRP